MLFKTAQSYSLPFPPRFNPLLVKSENERRRYILTSHSKSCHLSPLFKNWGNNLILHLFKQQSCSRFGLNE